MNKNNVWSYANSGSLVFMLASHLPKHGDTPWPRKTICKIFLKSFFKATEGKADLNFYWNMTGDTISKKLKKEHWILTVVVVRSGVSMQSGAHGKI